MDRHVPSAAIAAGLLLGAIAGGAGCRGGLLEQGGASSSASGGGAPDASSSGSSAALGSYRVTCSVYHRDIGAGVTEHERTSMVFMTDEPAERSIELPGAIPVRAKLADVVDAPGLVELTIEHPRSGLEQRFRLARDQMPPYELFGFHGFTGLNYVSTPGSSLDVQFICEASPRDEERPRPPPGPGSSGDEPAKPPPPAPFRVQCDISVGEGAAAVTDTFVLEGPTQRTVTLGGRTLELHLSDSPYEGRSFVVRLPGTLQQLYQIDRATPVTNTTRGPGGLTGMTTLRPGAGAADAGAADAGATGDDTISVACGAAD